MIQAIYAISYCATEYDRKVEWGTRSDRGIKL